MKCVDERRKTPSSFSPRRQMAALKPASSPGFGKHREGNKNWKNKTLVLLTELLNQGVLLGELHHHFLLGDKWHLLLTREKESGKTKRQYH